MERKAFLALREQRWEKLFPDVKDADLEVLLVPSEMPDLTTQKLLGVNTENIARDICTNAFIDFRGKSWLADDGSKIPNTLENRLEIYSFHTLRRNIQGALELRNMEAVTGESSAASD